MHDERSCPCSSRAAQSAAQHDAEAERGVLSSVLSAYPEIFTEAELVLEIANQPDDFGQRDRVKRAIQALAALGLLHRFHPLVIPSRAALRFEALEEGSAR